MRDRTGEWVDDDQDDVHVCERGWLDRDEDQPRPCPTCRPWLLERPPRRPTREELDAYGARHLARA
ncbi:hypothetical protein [Pseudonocardia sp. MH-G8]|uniref:hypothetical protein n=1 Tax=Pseudonocardia sp. MH-G8 TaxID=1854588 RepID=UPI000BA03927|nr:hypothetical protein [Pseudonocardia sp. MH-G8]OZM84097.1 hypothetical protein CFP66_06730 [Pseudonocardia sp. MH-G8]